MEMTMCDLRERGVLYVSTVEAAAAETQSEAGRLEALIMELEPLIGRERVTALDNALLMYAGAIETEYAARLVALLRDVTHHDHDVFVAPAVSGGAS